MPRGSLMSQSERFTCKLKLYNELILPVLLYGSETWTLKAEDEQLLNVFERKILRMIYGPIFVDGEVRRRPTAEIYSMCKQQPVVNKIRTKRLKWAGHVNRMDECLPARKVLFTNLSGTRSVGGQRKKWRNLVEQDTKKLGVRDWQSTSKDRSSWAKIISQADSR